jgi:hypothetical protein
MRGQLKACLTVLLCAAIPLFATAQETPTEQQRRLTQEAVANPGNAAKVDAFVKSLVETPRNSGRYVVEGDIVLSREEIESYLRDLKSPTSAPVKSGELVVNVVGGMFDYLVTPAQRQLTYVYQQSSFPNVESFEKTRAKFRSASAQWVAACPECGITFTEANADTATFVIRYEDLDDGTVARSFFPSSPASQRALVVFTPYLSLLPTPPPPDSFDAVGVLRHEIGHILGYRHEHIQNIPGCATEGTSWKSITPYTPNSVMHYFCGGKGSFDLSLRPNDTSGHRCLYLTGKACPVVP